MRRDGTKVELRESARWQLKDQLALATDEINKAMNRRVSAGAVLRGQVGAVEPQHVTPADSGLVIRVMVTGSAAIDVTRSD